MSYYFCYGLVTLGFIKKAQSNLDKASLTSSVRFLRLSSIFCLLDLSKRLIPSTTSELIDLPSIFFNSSSRVYLDCGTLIDVWISLSLLGLGIRSLDSFLLFTSDNIITSYFMALSIYLFSPLFKVYCETLKYKIKKVNFIYYFIQSILCRREKFRYFFLSSISCLTSYKRRSNKRRKEVRKMINEKNLNPVSDLLHSILDNLNETFQKDSLEVHLRRLDRVEEDLLTVLEKMAVA